MNFEKTTPPLQNIPEELLKKISLNLDQIQKIQDIKNNIGTVIEEDGEQIPFCPPIPEGWTYLQHGTNLLNWNDDENPYNTDLLTIDKPLSVITRESFERSHQNTQGSYNTTKNYSTAFKPKAMSEQEFEEKNQPFEIRVLFYQNHPRQRTRQEYTEKLGEETMKEIAKYYFLNRQSGRHPLIPKNEELYQFGISHEQDTDVFYYIPIKYLEDYLNSI